MTSQKALNDLICDVSLVAMHFAVEKNAFFMRQVNLFVSGAGF
jgi:hypothetical protein